MASDEMWQAHALAFGDYLRTQRRLAELSLRDLATRTRLSNAYLSQIERGLHQPSVRVMRAIAEALDIPPEILLSQAGLLRANEEPAAPPRTGPVPDVEAAILAETRLSESQQQALIAVYRSYLAT